MLRASKKRQIGNCIPEVSVNWYIGIIAHRKTNWNISELHLVSPLLCSKGNEVKAFKYNRLTPIWLILCPL